MAATSAQIVETYRSAFRRLVHGWDQGERLAAFMDDAGLTVSEYEPGWADRADPPPEDRFRLVGVPGVIAVPGNRLEAAALAAFDPATGTVFLREEQATDQFRALLLAHVLMHAFDAVMGIRAALVDAVGEHEGSLRDEVRAYELQMDFANQMTDGAFFRVLDELMVEMRDESDEHFLSEEGPPRLNAAFPPARSQREGGARLAFFTVAAAYWYADTVAARTKLRFMDDWWEQQQGRY